MERGGRIATPSFHCVASCSRRIFRLSQPSGLYPALVPHSGQNLAPFSSAPHLPHLAGAAATGAPHSGQNLAPMVFGAALGALGSRRLDHGRAALRAELGARGAPACRPWGSAPCSPPPAAPPRRALFTTVAQPEDVGEALDHAGRLLALGLGDLAPSAGCRRCRSRPSRRSPTGSTTAGRWGIRGSSPSPAPRPRPPAAGSCA